eukprot:5546168-Alexandrium_andersonii.AAC.1
MRRSPIPWSARAGLRAAVASGGSLLKSAGRASGERPGAVGGSLLKASGYLMECARRPPSSGEPPEGVCSKLRGEHAKGVQEQSEEVCSKPLGEHAES